MSSHLIRPGSERVRRHEYPQADNGAASEVNHGVHRDHFQVQYYITRPFDWSRQHQSGTDGACLPHVEFSPLVSRFDLKDVVDSRVATSGLHLEDI